MAKSLLPEEQVRQWMIDELIAAGIARSRIAVEYSITVGGRRLRVDLAIFGLGSTSISAIVECKAPNVTISEATLLQAAIYNSVIQARYIITTNGHQTYIYCVDQKRFIDYFASDL